MKMKRIKGALLLVLLLIAGLLIFIACADNGNASSSPVGSSQSEKSSTESKNTESSSFDEASETSSESENSTASTASSDNSASQEENSSIEEDLNASSSETSESSSSVESAGSSNELESSTDSDTSSTTESSSSSDNSESIDSSESLENSSSEEDSSVELPHIHVYDKIEILREASCEAEGLTRYSCECGNSYTENPASLGHESVIDYAVNATCVKEGLTEGSHCSRCGEVLQAQESTEIIPHNYENGYCAACNLVGLEFTVDETKRYAICTAYTGKTVRRVEIPDEYCGYPVKELAENLFAGCGDLYSIEIGENVEVIGEGAFSECYHLVEIYDRSKAQVTKYSKLENGALTINAEDDDIHYEAFESEIVITDDFVIFNDDEEGVLLTYLGSKKEIVIPEGVTKIASFAFSTHFDITKITMASSVRFIDVYAFYNCEQYIKEIHLLNPNGWQGMRKVNGQDGEWYDFGAVMTNPTEVCKTFVIDYKEYYFRRVD